MSLSVTTAYIGHDPDTDSKAVTAAGRDPDHSGFCFIDHCRDLAWGVQILYEAETIKSALDAAGFESAEILLHGGSLH